MLDYLRTAYHVCFLAHKCLQAPNFVTGGVKSPSNIGANRTPVLAILERMTTGSGFHGSCLALRGVELCFG